METITIICAVAAEFKGNGGEVYAVKPKELGCVLSAPAWIQKTRMFDLLAADGSLKFVTPHNKIQAENEPLLGLGADGKEIHTAEKKAQNAPKRASRKKNEADVQNAEEAAEPKTEGKDEA